MNRANAMLGLFAETSIHAGAGSTTGVVDLPIQREGHTGWPCVFGSAVKGALRARAEETCTPQSLIPVFGPTTERAHEHAGALAVGDARLLLLPVRSLTSHFKWVSCPAILQRLQRDLRRLGLEGLSDSELAAPADETTAIVAEGGDALFLEEYRFSVESRDLEALIQAIAALMDLGSAGRLREQLCIVSDNMFQHLAQHATPVAAHICIDNATKTVRPGALWYEETLPPETLLYTSLSADKARNGDAAMPAEAVLQAVLDLFGEHPYLQLGGNETVGMGWCQVTPLVSKE